MCVTLIAGVRIRAIIELKLQDLVNVPEYDLYRVTVYSESREPRKYETIRYANKDTPKRPRLRTIRD